MAALVGGSGFRGAGLSFIAALVALSASCTLITAPDDSLLHKHATGGAGGSGGGGAACTKATDCPLPQSECETASCTEGQCGAVAKAAGVPVSTQVLGDCKAKQCNGSGAAVDVTDDTDLPIDGKECTLDVCSNGVRSNPPKASGQVCGQSGTLTCDGAGQCVGCTSPAACAADQECQHPTCTGGVCGVDNVPQGTALAAQTAGDCKKAQCDGTGAQETVNDDSDVFVDGKECTVDACSAGAAINTPVSPKTMCSQNSGKLCDATGACVQCLIASDCPGSDTECQARSCNAGMCGVTNTTSGTLVASQTAGDCKKQVCNGNGAVVSATDDADLPNDNNLCTSDTCSAGASQFTPVSSGLSCGTGLVCNATGQCQGCNQPSDCGIDDQCKQYTCSGGTCGLNTTALGTAVSGQVGGDCKKNVCDGNGNTVSQSDDTDAPADDSNQCTGEACNAGVPSHPVLGTNALCAQNGGSFCDGAGSCVACNAPGQCTGSDTECHTRTCLAHACGVMNTTVGFVTSAQSAGDCHQSQCNGIGGVVQVTDDTDLPLDDGIQCTGEACTLGVPSHPAKAVDFGCNQLGGAFCDGGGTCVQCNQSAQCSSMVCDTGAHTCSAPSCTDGVMNGIETDMDCGGGCPACGPGKGCAVHGDCAGGACNPTTHTCAPTCTDSQAPGATCATYCGCMTATCGSKFASQAACIDACASFIESQLCCRGYHCTAAMSDSVTHCPHAAGEAVCQ